MIILIDRVQLINILIIFTIAILFWLSIVFVREIKKKDIEILRKNIISTCNMWCVGHFFTYLILGYLAPKYWIHIIIVGILFEILEMFLNKISVYIDSKLIEDSVVNSLGVLIGVLLYKIYPINIDLYSLTINT